MHPYKRSERVSSLLQREIAGFLERNLSDPRLKKVTITKLEMTDDLKLARVFFSVMGADAEQAECLQGLNHAKGMIKKLIGERVYLRSVPDLEFKYDPGLEYSQRVEDLLKKIHEKDEPESQDPDGN